MLFKVTPPIEKVACPSHIYLNDNEEDILVFSFLKCFNFVHFIPSLMPNKSVSHFRERKLAIFDQTKVQEVSLSILQQLFKGSLENTFIVPFGKS